MKHAADADLVRDARRGNEASFTSLLRPLLEPAYRLAAGMPQDRQLAEDAVQEAAVNAWRKLYQLKEGTEMGPWFFGIVANECRTTRRSRWWSVLRVGAEKRGVEAPIEEAVRGLVIVLYFYLDLPLEEIRLSQVRPWPRFASASTAASAS